jgi:hypothetical protein
VVESILKEVDDLLVGDIDYGLAACTGIAVDGEFPST